MTRWQKSGRSAKNGEVFDGFEVRYVPRLDNRDADHLAWIDFPRAPISSDVIIKKLTKPSVKAVEPLRDADLMIIDEAEQQPEIDWMSQYQMIMRRSSALHANPECIT
jgi:hypothetical protein